MLPLLIHNIQFLKKMKLLIIISEMIDDIVNKSKYEKKRNKNLNIDVKLRVSCQENSTQETQM